jgi:DNA repair protein RecO (recombination protein O)
LRRHEDEAYVLGSRELGEADLIVTLLAHQHGIVRGVAPSARASRKRYGGYLEPMSRVRAVWVERDGRELHRVERIEGLRSFAAMQAEPVRQAACAVVAEVAGAFVQEGHGEPGTFRLVGAVLEALERGGDPWALVRYFEYWMLRLHGLMPDIAACGGCGAAFGADSRPAVVPGSGLLCDLCCGAAADLPRLGPAGRELLGRMRHDPPERMTAGSAAARSAGALERLLRGTLESYAERAFRSYRHFRHAEGGERS